MHKTRGKEFRNSLPADDFGYVPVNIHTYFNLQLIGVIVYRKFCRRFVLIKNMLLFRVNATFNSMAGVAAPLRLMPVRH